MLKTNQILECSIIFTMLYDKQLRDYILSIPNFNESLFTYPDAKESFQKIRGADKLNLAINTLALEIPIAIIQIANENDILDSSDKIDNVVKLILHENICAKLEVEAQNFSVLAGKRLNIEFLKSAYENLGKILAQATNETDEFNAPEIAEKAQEYMNTLTSEEGRNSIAVNFGMQQLDDRYLGLGVGLHLCAARSGHTKSTVLYSILSSYMEKHANREIFLVSTEVNEKKLPIPFSAFLMDCNKNFDNIYNNVFTSNLHKGKIDKEQNELYSRYLKNNIATKNIRLTGNRDIEQIVMKIRKWRNSQTKEERAELALVGIDFINECFYKGVTVNDRNTISAVSALLKGLAYELNLCIIILSQMNLKADSRENKEPKMEDVYEGKIWYDTCEFVFAPYSEYFFLPVSQREKKRFIQYGISILKAKGGSGLGLFLGIFDLFRTRMNLEVVYGETDLEMEIDRLNVSHLRHYGNFD